MMFPTPRFDGRSDLLPMPAQLMRRSLLMLGSDADYGSTLSEYRRWLESRSVSPALPPLPADLATSEDQGYDKAAHLDHLKRAHLHAKAAVKCLSKALAALDAEPLGGLDDDVDPALFDDDEVGPNPQERARRAALFVLRSLS